MADAPGTDLLIKILDGLTRLERKVEHLERHLGERIDHTNDTMTLLGSVIHQLTVATKGRVDDHENRITALESD